MNKLKFVAFALLGISIYHHANAQWVPNVSVNTPVCTANGDQSEPKMISDGVGGMYIVWKDFRNLNSPDAFLQRVNKYGVSQWIVDGLNVCVNPLDQSTPNLCSDGANGVIATWSDLRNGTDRNIYAQRIDSNGLIQWAFNGVVVADKSVREYNEKIISDGEGGAIIVWEQGANNIYDVWAQRIDGSGVAMWQSGGIAVSTATSAKLNAAMVLGADKNIYTAWQDARNGNNDIFAQKMSLNGDRLWGNAAKSVIVETDRQEEPRIDLPPNGLGIYVSWVDRRLGFGNNDIYAQRLDSAGIKKWVSTAIPVCSANGNQTQVALLSEGISNGFLTTWRDYRSGGSSDLYLQKIDSNGAAVYAPNGIILSNDPGDQLNATMIQDTNGGAIIAWQDKNGGNTNLRAQKINKAGVYQWGNFATISNASGEQIAQKLLPDGEDGIYAVWQDERDTANFDIKAQHIRANGIYIPTNIDGINKSMIAVWPNPFNNQINISGSANINAKCSVMDITGKLINSTTIWNGTQITVLLPIDIVAGIYFLHVQDETKKHVVKIVKQ